MNPFNVNDKTKDMVITNIQFVLNSFLSGSYSTVIFTWVLHLDSIVELIRSAIRYDHNFFHFTLVCDEKILQERINSDNERTTDICLALDRLQKSRLVNSEIIDTSKYSPFSIANFLKTKIIS
ncbi:hypothetical protein X474_19220 [Dethiosulfatarculus sandiegensis]|uniref:Uncharacterized protein n=2 Tax=Dethiosulfatarculus sandiegensis TaxID=1429043 RepID=A0A0D2J2R8_9BACT|nr:hypothetical protein X474_19220 [Dethiosulfatarculus sandiegensis]